MNNDAWGAISSEYDNNLEKNFDQIISDYISEEIKIIANLCNKMI